MLLFYFEQALPTESKPLPKNTMILPYLGEQKTLENLIWIVLFVQLWHFCCEDSSSSSSSEHNYSNAIIVCEFNVFVLFVDDDDDEAKSKIEKPSKPQNLFLCPHCNFAVTEKHNSWPNQKREMLKRGALPFPYK